ncbi:MAG: hypothetical protein K8T20_13345 [Planctomycetes bacterium]|nr:hypothetical protein [Planctomycetota bacterium]
MISFFCSSCGKKIGLPFKPPGGQAECPYCFAVTPVVEAGPRALGPIAITWIGDQLRFPRGSNFPRSPCGMCGSAEVVTEKRKTFAWAPSTVWLGWFLFGPLGMFILYIVQRQVQEIRVPVCRPCADKWRASEIGYPLVSFGGFALLVLLIAGIASRNVGGAGVATVILLAIVSWITACVVLWHRWVLKTRIASAKVDEAGLTLRHPRPEVMRELIGQAYTSPMPPPAGPRRPPGYRPRLSR